MYYNDSSYLISICLWATLLGLIPAAIAKNKGHSFFEWWFLGAAFFIIALPLAIFLKPKMKISEGQRVPKNSRKCPYCSEFVQEDAQLCKHCGKELSKEGFSISDIQRWNKEFVKTMGWNETIGRNTAEALEDLLKLPLEDPPKIIFIVYADTKTYFVEEIRLNKKILKSRQSALIATFQRLIFVDPNEPYVFDCLYSEMMDLRTDNSDKSMLVNIHDKAGNEIFMRFSFSRDRVSINQAGTAFGMLASFFKQLKNLSLVELKSATTQVETESRNALLQAEIALTSGDKKTAGVLIDQVLKKDFTNLIAWQLLYQLLGAGKDFSTFQEEFTLKYYPDKYSLLQKR